uniref:Uncharacterized protein n=1 Tax=Spironucleus salmonicida TaxID=348837 RepID=V6LWG9_9EUKA|eukprot:EST48915.1 Hypothetical protein SS50377_10840 [Spironucleus salmonicida]
MHRSRSQRRQALGVRPLGGIGVPMPQAAAQPALLRSIRPGNRLRPAPCPLSKRHRTGPGVASWAALRYAPPPSWCGVWDLRNDAPRFRGERICSREAWA